MMTHFSKQSNCPLSETLLAYRQDALPLLAQQATTAHLKACDFCGAELQLLARAAHVAIPPAPTPPMPLALRLYAESQLAAQVGDRRMLRQRAA
jgi:hypothetical protein